MAHQGTSFTYVSIGSATHSLDEGEIFKIAPFLPLCFVGGDDEGFFCNSVHYCLLWGLLFVFV